jgi:pimeloyl-ACP methyl ester carboxylesterase
VLVGEGGGAALAANLAGLKPGAVDAVVLVGCPCALPEWRSHMGKRTGRPGWRAPVASLDPLKSAGGVPSQTRVAVLVGSADPVTPPRLSRAYAEALALRGIATDYRILPGKGHDLLNDPEVLTVTAGLAARLRGKP